MRTPLGLAVAIATMGAGLAGCNQPIAHQPSRAPIATGEYDAVFEAAIRELRSRKFVIDRQDRRFGLITTEPRIAASAFEPWHGDNTTGQQVLASTLNLQRRVVQVRIKPKKRDAAGKAADSQQRPSTDAGASAKPKQDGGPAGQLGDYTLDVTVFVERQHNPPRDLSTAAMKELTFRRHHELYRPLRTERGREESYWRRIGPDPHLAGRLTHDILERALTSKAQAAERSTGNNET